MLIGGIIIGFLSSILILQWAINKPSIEVLSWYFNRADGWFINITKIINIKGKE
jgi:hypothetical protein